MSPNTAHHSHTGGCLSWAIQTGTSPTCCCLPLWHAGLHPVALLHGPLRLALLLHVVLLLLLLLRVGVLQAGRRWE
jgi:hypothetical protein